MVPLPKSTDKTNPTNYRPISLLSVLSKLLEKHVHIYLNDYLEKRQLLHPFQSGFRRKYSCNTALTCFTYSWLTAMNESGVSGVVFLDVSLDIDFVDHVFFHLFLNLLFITESNAFYSMDLTPMKIQ